MQFNPKYMQTRNIYKKVSVRRIPEKLKHIVKSVYKKRKNISLKMTI